MNEVDLLDVRTLQRRAGELAASLGLAEFRLASEAMHNGSPHLEVTDVYYLVVTERGCELERRRTMDADELLYWVMEGETSSLAWDHERTHRRRGEDPRRQAFARQIELLATLSPEWAERRRREQAEILGRNPFRDG